MRGTLREKLVTSALVAGCCAVPAASGRAQGYAVDVSLRVAAGRYTLEETVTSAFLVNEVKYTGSRWYVGMVVPVVYQDSAEVQYVGGMPVPTGHHDGSGGDGHHEGGGGGGGGLPGDLDSQPQDFDELGLADPYLTFGAVVFRDVFDRSSFGAFVSVKAPVADDSQGFGTGEWDLGAGVSWLRRTQRNLLSAELTYWSLGDPPDMRFNNPVAFELAYGRVLSASRVLIEAAIWGRTETVEGIDGPIAADFTLSRSLKRQHSVYFTAEVGFTESAPDYALVIGYRTGIWR